MRAHESTLLATELVTGVAALGGAVYGLRGAPDVPVGWLEGSPFRTYAVPAAVLGVGVGGSMLAAAEAVARGRPTARPLSVTAGTMLVGWIAAQVGIIGWRSPLQPACLGIGLLTITLARRAPRAWA